MESIYEVANDILNGKKKISEVPDFRKKRVLRVVSTIPKETIAHMAEKSKNKNDPSSVKGKSLIHSFTSKLRSVKSS